MTSRDKEPELDNRKAEAGWAGPTSISGKSIKAFCALMDFSEMTSRDYPPELDMKKSGGALVRGDKYKTNMPERRFVLFGMFVL
ncbi:hypothetical protein KH172YL63_28200 [Bacillus sp. KH172YL63]|nr:hypothetical protein KH172YL63_28200 [Bacillus sp. KH172YL63]